MNQEDASESAAAGGGASSSGPDPASTSSDFRRLQSLQDEELQVDSDHHETDTLQPPIPVVKTSNLCE